MAGTNERFTPELAERIVTATGAGTLVTGVIYQRGDSIEVQARVLRSADLKPIFSLGPERSISDDPSAALAATRERVLGAVGVYLSAAGWRWRGGDVSLYQPPGSLASFRMIDKVQALHRQGRSSEAAPIVREALRRDTSNLGAAVLAALVYHSVGNPLSRERDSVLADLEAKRDRLMRGDAMALDWLAAVFHGSPEQGIGPHWPGSRRIRQAGHGR